MAFTYVTLALYVANYVQLLYRGKSHWLLVLGGGIDPDRLRERRIR